MRLWILGILFIAVFKNYGVTTIRATPLGSPLAEFGSRQQQSSQFGEGVRDWFKNVKNRFLGSNDQRSLPPAEAGKLIMELENENPEERRRNKPSGFFVDLANLTFDPDRDWGFRLGQWYFIRRSNSVKPTDDWASSNNPTEWPTMGEDDDEGDPTNIPLVTFKYDDSTTMVASTTLEADQSPEVTESAVTTEPKNEDNETNEKKPESMKSIEVLSPSE